MTLAELLTPARIIAEMQAIEHWPAITELVDHLVKIGDIPQAAREGLLAAIREREDQCSTGIGSGLAIPHVYSEVIDATVAVFGRSTSGIEFGAIDSNPVKFIVLFVIPKAQYQSHLRTLAAVARKLNNANIRQQLAAAADTTEILALLQDLDRPLDA